MARPGKEFFADEGQWELVLEEEEGWWELCHHKYDDYYKAFHCCDEISHGRRMDDNLCCTSCAKPAPATIVKLKELLEAI